MRKKLLFLILALAAVVGSLAAHATDDTDQPPCPRICTTYADGSQCCLNCFCVDGVLAGCTQNICPPAGGGVRG